jgi:hypothetical protein
MSPLTNDERAAVEAVARHRSATLEQDDDAFDGSFSIDGKRIPLTVRTLVNESAERLDGPRPRLRFDKVALRVLQRLRDALHEAVPDGNAMILTMTAPIRVPAETAEALERTLPASLASGRLAFSETIHGNRVTARLVRSDLSRSAKVIGFVHNPDSDPDVLFAAARSLIASIGSAAVDRGKPKTASESWLILANQNGHQHIETFRSIFTQLSMPDSFAKILIVFADGRVETLAG